MLINKNFTFLLFISLIVCCINISIANENNPSSDKKKQERVLEQKSSQLLEQQNGEQKNKQKYSEIYNVKKRDTLWDISDKKLQSPYRWPALWGRNPHIRNPHWIYPGETIYLYDHRNSSNTNQSASLSPVYTPTEPLEKIEVNQPYYYFYPLMESVGYIKERAVNPIGKIMSCMPQFQKEIDIDNGVYLQVNDESNIMVGDQFQILRTFYIRDKNSTTFPLVQHYITGVVEVTKLKSKPCKCHEQVSQIEGKIIKAYRTIFADDILIPYNPVDSKILVRQSNENINAKILFSEDHKKQISENAIVFIDKGKADGLQTGQFYDIYNQPRGELIEPDKFIEKTERIGELVVLHMEDTTSSALITYSYKDIAPGDIMVTPHSKNAVTNTTLMGNYK
ncbi:MAG: LysM peptidoglycan-binding domain-containing protein [Desulfamplus sp.]|nr:LysM peptidoglycan-binding domain-containing protein [Desulfamplus sp.]